MIVFPRREKFIRNNFIEFSFNSENKLPDFQLFEQLSSAEQYYIAQNFNWDDGVEVLRWIIESKKCDKGTASLIFWTSEPDYYFEKSEKQISEYEKDVFLLLRTIVNKFNNNEFIRSIIKYDPTERVEQIDWAKRHLEWEIPEEIKRPTKGFSIVSVGIIKQRIWQWQHNRRERTRAAKRAKNSGGRH